MPLKSSKTILESRKCYFKYFAKMFSLGAPGNIGRYRQRWRIKQVRYTNLYTDMLFLVVHSVCFVRTFHTYVYSSSSISPNGEHSPNKTSQCCFFISFLSLCYGQKVPAKLLNDRKSNLLQASTGRFSILQLFQLFTCRAVTGRCKNLHTSWPVHVIAIGFSDFLSDSLICRRPGPSCSKVG